MTPEEERAFTERVLAEVRRQLDEWAANFTRGLVEQVIRSMPERRS